MKFMRDESWCEGCADAPPTATMRLGTTGVPHPLIWRTRMQWQTPTATDFRFGFEITLYVAAR